jgi:hypothetical protein
MPRPAPCRLRRLILPAVADSQDRPSRALPTQTPSTPPCRPPPRPAAPPWRSFSSGRGKRPRPASAPRFSGCRRAPGPRLGPRAREPTPRQPPSAAPVLTPPLPPICRTALAAPQDGPAMRSELLHGLVLPVAQLRHAFQLGDAWNVAVGDWLGAGAAGEGGGRGARGGWVVYRTAVSAETKSGRERRPGGGGGERGAAWALRRRRRGRTHGLNVSAARRPCEAYGTCAHVCPRRRPGRAHVHLAAQPLCEQRAVADVHRAAAGASARGPAGRLPSVARVRARSARSHLATPAQRLELRARPSHRRPCATC